MSSSSSQTSRSASREIHDLRAMDFIAVYSSDAPAVVRAALLKSPPEMFVHCSADLARTICDMMKVLRPDLPRFDVSSRRQWLYGLTPPPDPAAVDLRSAESDDAAGVALSGQGGDADDAEEKGAPVVSGGEGARAARSGRCGGASGHRSCGRRPPLRAPESP